MSDGTIAKRGEQIFNLSFRRLDGKLSVYIKAHHTLADLLKSWGSGVSGGLLDYGGRNWIFRDKPWPLVWDLSSTFDRPMSYGDGFFTLSSPGQELYVPPEICGTPGGIVNISYLRLVGIENGIEFELPGVFSVSLLKETQEKSTKAVKRLYVDYLLPLDLTAQVVTQETRL